MMKKGILNMERCYRLLFMAAMVSSIILAGIPKVYVNPIPAPTLILEREDINVFLSRVDGSTMEVSVRGVYPFANVGYKNADMFFPVPREAVDSKNIGVWIDGRPLFWEIVEKGYFLRGGERVEFTYETLDGTYQLVKWHVDSLPERFEIIVEYSYKVQVKEGEFKTLYAMATGRFADVYAKRCTAYVSVEFVNFREYMASVSLVSPPSSGIGSSWFQFGIESDRVRFNVTEESSMFNGLSRDIFFTLKSKPEQTWEWRPYLPINLMLWVDISGNGVVNLTANILFKHGGYKVDWGEAYLQPNLKTITVDAKVLEWTGPSTQVIMNLTYSYMIGPLKPGDYVVQYRVNDVALKTLALTVPERPAEKQVDFNEPVLYMVLGLTVATVIILAAKRMSPPS
ncbi:MAG: hypothetical protein ACUVQ8_07900 [Nitrososphaeria archaeon]